MWLWRWRRRAAGRRVLASIEGAQEILEALGMPPPQRLVELQEMAEGAEAGLVFVTAFPNFAEFRKHIDAIAWETEVWMADRPDHMIRYNGDRFLGPRR